MKKNAKVETLSGIKKTIPILKILILICNICSVIGQFVYNNTNIKKNINDFKKK